MKTKVKLEAWRNIGTQEVRWFKPTNAIPGTVFERFHEWDLERDIEVEDEPKTAREFTLLGVKEGNREWLYHFHEPVKGHEGNIIHVVEVLPGSVQVTREQLENAWFNSVGLINRSSISFYQFCRAIGLDDK